VGVSQLAPRLASQAVDSLVGELRPIEAGPGSKPLVALGGDGPTPPRQVRAELGAMLAIERFGLPPALVAALKHLASLHNPAVYEKERLRLSTWNTPRFVRCYHETLDRLVLPRGLLSDAQRLLADAGSLVIGRPATHAGADELPAGGGADPPAAGGGRRPRQP
jgi:hypothetical protein